MHFFYALLQLTTLVIAAPTGTTSAPSSTETACQAKTFNKPWTLNDITMYDAAGQDSSNANGAISFQFCDTNNGLEMETTCSGTVIDGNCEGDDGGYVLCANSTVSFKLESKKIMMTRAFIDDCLGPPPYNAGRAFGENNTDMILKSNSSGTLWWQEMMEVSITEMG